jgi:excisionase family DNA binding protein
MEQPRYNPFETLEHRLSAIQVQLECINDQLSAKEMEKKFYSIEEAAEKLKVATITLYRNTKSGKIPSKKVGSRTMIPGSFIDGK